MHDVSNVTLENVLKTGVKDVIADQLVSAQQLMERQHMLIVSQRGQISMHLSDLKIARTIAPSVKGRAHRHR